MFDLWLSSGTVGIVLILSFPKIPSSLDSLLAAYARAIVAERIAAGELDRACVIDVWTAPSWQELCERFDLSRYSKRGARVCLH